MHQAHHDHSNGSGSTEVEPDAPDHKHRVRKNALICHGAVAPLESFRGDGPRPQNLPRRLDRDPFQEVGQLVFCGLCGAALADTGRRFYTRRTAIVRLAVVTFRKRLFGCVPKGVIQQHLRILNILQRNLLRKLP